ncbi:uncharacterized protein LOC129146228 isoform X2 [Talpa occidentalis]|uniref:uncharacterized protein LOC129146228 isoform X2 n=1 Tax=Talpa occidentalis TaxID=50954 RepID=UPI0023F8896C|nr:uncharacterized protein LOC129146228 isoform X2 [Talpa occidentalis]
MVNRSTPGKVEALERLRDWAQYRGQEQHETHGTAAQKSGQNRCPWSTDVPGAEQVKGQEGHGTGETPGGEQNGQLLQEHTDRCLPQPVPPSPDAPVNLLCPGDQVLLKAISPKPLPPKWMGPHTIILTTPTAVKVLSNMSWHQLSRVKPVPVDKQYVCECWAQLSLLEATQIRSTSLTQPWPQALKQVPARRLAGNPRLTLTRVVGAGLAETLHPLPRSRAPSSSRSPRRLILTSCGRSPSSTPYGGVR